MPPTVPIHHFSMSSKPTKQDSSPILLFQVNTFRREGLLWAFWFAHGNTLGQKTKPTEVNPAMNQALSPRPQPIWLNEEPAIESSSVNSTTDVLTATTLIYAFGAGITAAAGTRLALQLILVKGFKLYSFQLQGRMALHCYLLSLPPRVGIG